MARNTEPRERLIRPPHEVSLRLTLGWLRRGRFDPSMRVGTDGVWRATRTPEGNATVLLVHAGAEIRVQAWGPGAAWALDAAPELVGVHDRDTGFRPEHPVLRDLHRRLAGLRIARSKAVVEALVPSIIEQKVVGREARRAYAGLVRRFGERAPGPAGESGLFTPPSPRRLAELPYWAFHPFGVERRRADAVRRVASVAPRLEEAVALPPAEARRRLQAVPGVGAWTAAEVAIVALGDADAVSVGDFHLPNQVAWALAGEPRGDDARMLELLEPYRGHRGRVIRLLEAGGFTAPRYGPRLPLQSIAPL
jgi:3-methyladenine DNA glycosylase/8-oxoguanine DNA glycosylase